jgi:hypothetical protein
MWENENQVKCSLITFLLSINDALKLNENTTQNKFNKFI